MSHHLDSPIARQDARLDITDVYLFRGERGTVFVMNVSHSLAGQDVRGFHPEAMYEFKIDGDGDAVEDLTYRVTFTDRLQLRRVTDPDPHAPGILLAEGPVGATVDAEDGTRLWTGEAGDPFWIEPDVLHAVGHAFQDGTKIDLSGWEPAAAANLFAGHTVHSIVLEIPDAALLAVAPDRRIGFWGLTTLATDAGGWRRINRAGLPMMHPLFTQFNEDLGNRLNDGRPADDPNTYGKSLVDMVAGVVAANGTARDPRAYAETVVSRLLPNVLPYTIGTPAVFGFAGWNGRSMTDNAPDVMFSFASNSPVSLGIGRESVTAKPSDTWPYVPTRG
ncbi:DUF4331 family protein [Kutzneria sp. CA-103260]|uniref:DUF4331 family protein n=1 Tax=Kutzneria sp. CA-103260 TaxID=2802641 RepID=UPI001BA88D29|nr:DUF4331 family protein [Kutzneria sp. CA-103260]QUQ65822.1 hypothetical protein JJ691_35470 [Kutzneria sp. CA-103260]